MHELHNGIGAYPDGEYLVIYELDENGTPRRLLGKFDLQHQQWLVEMIQEHWEKTL